MVDASGTYTAPALAPTPNALQVEAVSQDDPTQNGSANITISNAPNIRTIHPSSVFAGALKGFTLQVDGSGFVPAIYFNPSDSAVTFATPSALSAHPSSYDLESILTHELGHFFGFSHSAVWSSQYVGSIEGHVLPANPLSLPASPPNVTGSIFGAHVVAVDSASGAVVAGVLGGWSCQAAGPVQFDGSYALNHLPVGHTYAVYAEPLEGAVAPSEVSNALVTLCRNATSDPGWPQTQSCVVPEVSQNFTARTRPEP